jgi:hypothetical protein
VNTTACLLGSFYYWARADVGAIVNRAARRGIEVDFFADSGAFSAAGAGETISVKQYATWLGLHAPHINFAAGLDVIGDYRQSRANTEALEDAVGDAVVIVPTFHANSPWHELERLCASHRFVALGGAVPYGARERAMLAWLVKAHKIAREHGTVLHGFGLTRPPYPHALPWYSVDSSYWSAAARTGTLALFDQRRQRFTRIRVGTTAAAKHGALVRSYGADPAWVAQHNFARVKLRGDAGREEYRWLVAVSAEAWLRYADWLAAGRTVPAPPGVKGDGTKVYLAASRVRAEWDCLLDAYADHATTRQEAS